LNVVGLEFVPQPKFNRPASQNVRCWVVIKRAQKVIGRRVQVRMVQNVKEFRTEHERLAFQLTDWDWEAPLDAGIPENLAGAVLRISANRSEPAGGNDEVESVFRERIANACVQAILCEREKCAGGRGKTELHTVDTVVIKGGRFVDQKGTVVSTAAITVNVKAIIDGVRGAALDTGYGGPLPAVGKRLQYDPRTVKDVLSLFSTSTCSAL